MNQILTKKLLEYNIKLKTSQIDLFEKFLSLFIEKNSQINLSAIRDEEGIIEKHFIDSVILNGYLKLQGEVLDIGTGGGFPGIPLAITNEEVNFTLLDSTHKKIDSVNEFIDKLGLKNAKGIWGRAEELSKTRDLNNRFDFVVSRATAYLSQIFLWSLPFLKKGGKMVFYKSFNIEEIESGERMIKRYGCCIEETYRYFFLGQDRILIVISR